MEKKILYVLACYHELPPYDGICEKEIIQYDYDKEKLISIAKEIGGYVYINNKPDDIVYDWLCNNNDDSEDLQNILDDSCLSTASEGAVDYIKEKLKSMSEIAFNGWFYDIFHKLNDFQKWLLLSALTGSDIDIFTSWYVSCLYECTLSDNAVLKERARSIYDYYKDSFNKVRKDTEDGAKTN